MSSLIYIKKPDGFSEATNNVDYSLEINENSNFEAILTTAYKSDDEAITAEFSLVEDFGQASFFNLDKTTGSLSFKENADYESGNSLDNEYSVKIKATHNSGETAESIIKIVVKNLEDDNDLSLTLTKPLKDEYQEGETINIGGYLTNFSDNHRYIYWKLDGAGIDIFDLNYSSSSTSNYEPSLEGYTKIRHAPSGEKYINIPGFSDLEIGRIANDVKTEGDESFEIKFYSDSDRTNLIGTSGISKIIDSSIDDTNTKTVYTLENPYETIVRGLTYEFKVKRTNTDYGINTTGYLPFAVQYRSSGWDYIWFFGGQSEYSIKFTPRLSVGYPDTEVNNESYTFTAAMYDPNFDLDNSVITTSWTVIDFPYQSNTQYSLSEIKDYDGNLHANNNASEEVKSSYKYQGFLDINDDGIKEAIFTNQKSGRWATASLNLNTGLPDYSQHGEGGITRIVGIYIDPLVQSGDVIEGSDFDSQRRFQNDLNKDNLTVKASGDYDGDGFREVYWKTNDGSAYLRALMHADGNIQYANYQSESQMRDYLTSNGSEFFIGEIG